MNDDVPPASSGAGSAHGGRGRRRLGELNRRLHSHPALALTTKVVVTVVGVAVLLGGVVMLVAPGPGIVGIVVGLAILATEWEWAERWLRAAREKARQARVRAEQMDPKVRRRRLALAVGAVLAVAVCLVVYVSVYDWPALAVSGWDRVQDLARWAPELPGM